MKFFKKIGTYFSILTLLISGASFKSFAQEEGSKGPVDEFDDPNEVKVVIDKYENALCFSREPIPSRKKELKMFLCSNKFV